MTGALWLFLCMILLTVSAVAAIEQRWPAFVVAVAASSVFLWRAWH